MSDKVRYPYSVAMAIALDLKNRLLPFCKKIEIVGSLRRQRAYVGDIELLLIPDFVPDINCLFSKITGMVDLANHHISFMVQDGTLQKRKNSKGSYTWGSRNKLAVHVDSQIPVDFFSTTLKNWFMSLVIRTGGKKTNIALAMAARKSGLKLNPYGEGYTDLKTGRVLSCNSESEVFSFVGLRYRRPEHRQ